MSSSNSCCYVCGYSGFRQLSSLKNSTHDFNNYFGDPLKIETKQIKKITFTWSQVWIQTIEDEHSVQCYGFRSEDINTAIRKHKSAINSVIHCGSNTILTDKHNEDELLVSENGSVKPLSCEEAGVKLLSATEEQVFGTNRDGQLYCSNLQNKDDRQPSLSLRQVDLAVPVSMVACGFEHTLILSSQGSVFSCGSGSRGQLGHGELAVEVVTIPTRVADLSDCGIKIIMIAAGGWHSVALSDTGDVYVWGWNESGQLGLPGGVTLTETGASEGHSPSVTDSTSRCVHESTVQIGGSPPGASSDTDKECSQDRETGATDVAAVTSREKLISQPENEISRTDGNIRLTMNTVSSSTSYCGPDHLSDTSRTQTLNSETDWFPVMVKQDMEPVQMMLEPFALDLPEEFIVTQVACGSRHTCILLKHGLLLTCGNNQFGQLGHGDVVSRDFLQTVSCFMDTNEDITQVEANMWNTAIFTTPS